MRIDKKEINGLYIYNETITYTKGDLLVGDDGQLFVVLRDVKGKNPSKGPFPDDYKPYSELGNTATYDDFIKYIKNESTEDPNRSDKIVTLELLVQVMDSFSTGINYEGIITSSILPDKIVFADYLGNPSEISILTDPLDYLMIETDLNNAYFKVSGDVILQYINLPGSIPLPDETGILRQYTYRDIKDDSVIRVQELISPKMGILLFRFSISADGETFVKSRTSEWRGFFTSTVRVKTSASPSYAPTIFSNVQRELASQIYQNYDQASSINSEIRTSLTQGR